MPSIHQWAKSLATSLISKHGRTAHLVTLGTNQAKPWDKPETTKTLTDVTVVQSQFTAQERDSNLIEDADKLYLMDSSVEPNTAQRLLDGGREYSIISVDTLHPGPDVIRYKVQARL